MEEVMIMQHSARKGFTLIELLVVIAIIAVLAAILFPVFARVQESGRAAKCANNMKQINTALLAYVDDYNGRFPDSPGLWSCKYFAVMDSMPISGPFMQDLLAKYVRSSAVWLCPSVKPNDKIPPPPDHPTVIGIYRTWTTGTGAGKDTPTNYAWNHMRYKKGNTTGVTIMVSGTSVSLIVRPTKAVMFTEFPYWAPTPHKLSANKGYAASVSVVFYDGHVKLTRVTGHSPEVLSWQGWEY